jgi:four helix bundle protein
MTATELKQRTKEFALRSLKAVDCLPKSVSGRTVAGQLARAATSVAANYRAVCRARSRAEFIAKLGIVEEEADECAFWLELIVEGGLLAEAKVSALRAEAEQLVKIIAASRISAARNKAAERTNRQSPMANRQ